MPGEFSDQDSTHEESGPALAPPVALTATQHRILEALCRPASGGSRYSTPATNQEIAGEVFLSVDAVKAHLRTLYRKFGIEDLAHNEKRARLVELVLEGGYLGAGVGEATGSGAAVPVEPAAGSSAGEPVARRRRLWPITAALAVAIAAAIAILGLSGAFSSGKTASTGLAAYKTAVRGYCHLALAGEEENPGPSTRERASSYLEVIETMRGRLESLPPPAGADRALERFRNGLSHAADFTSLVAQNPPSVGTRAEANVVAELTFAAGQVQAGALGYGLGPRCIAIGDLVTRSARNAAHAP